MATALVQSDFHVQNQQGLWIQGVDEDDEFIYTPNRKEAHVFNRGLLKRWQMDREHRVVFVGVEPEPVVVGAAVEGEKINVQIA